jgi:hypothetical protein
MYDTKEIIPNIVFHGADDSRGVRYIQLTIDQEILVNYSRFIIQRLVALRGDLSGIFAFEFNLN